MARIDRMMPDGTVRRISARQGRKLLVIERMNAGGPGSFGALERTGATNWTTLAAQFDALTAALAERQGSLAAP